MIFWITMHFAFKLINDAFSINAGIQSTAACKPGCIPAFYSQKKGGH